MLNDPELSGFRIREGSRDYRLRIAANGHRRLAGPRRPHGLDSDVHPVGGSPDEQGSPGVVESGDLYRLRVGLPNAIQLPSDCRAVQSLRVNDGGIYREPKPPRPKRWRTPLRLPARVCGSGSRAATDRRRGPTRFRALSLSSHPPLADSPLQVNWLIQREPGCTCTPAAGSPPHIQDDSCALVGAANKDILERMQGGG